MSNKLRGVEDTRSFENIAVTPVVKKEQKVFFHYMEQSAISKLFAVVCSNFPAEFKKAYIFAA